MKKLSIIFSLVVIVSISQASSNPIHLLRRQTALEKMSPNGLLILQTQRNGYRFGFGFEQESNLFFLTGSNEPDIILILSKPGIQSPVSDTQVHSIIIKNPPPSKMVKSDEYYRMLQDSLGIDLVCGSKELRKILNSIRVIDQLYTNVIKSDQREGNSILEKRLIELVERLSSISIQQPEALLAQSRRIKDSGEIADIQKAIDITTLAHKEAMKSMTPGLFEYQIEAVVEYIFKFHGLQQLAFPTIVGSGPNSLDLHYELGVRQIESGDMVVVDIGCEYNHYCADITRTIPASGKFTPQQKEIYNIVLEANLAVIDMLRPGLTMAQMDSLARAVFAKYGYEKYWRHGCTHHLGLDVHDIGDTSLPLVPGCVVTVEPGLYIPPNPDLPKEYWNIGVRIEDDVLITEDGHRVLTAACPKTVEEIEALMKMDGLGNIRF
ncbi:MAG: aminopeptidase P family protein [candidate division KSB1 bacterium]|nr:aminopeptidase P family protein [candidate division KSB1 bacterium]MDZ7358731.1 aminopeptidase P family protein [candidate division KSB1 bacterium]